MRPAQIKLLLFLLVILLISNGVLLYLLLNKNTKKAQTKSKAERQIEYVVKKLELNPGQEQSYRNSRALRDSQLRAVEPALLEMRNQLVSQIMDPLVTDSAIFHTISAVSKAQEPVEIAYTSHFIRLRKITPKEKLPTLDSMLHNMVKRNATFAPKQK